LEELAVKFSKTQIKRGEEEAEAIKNESSPEALLKRMRGKFDPLNYVLIHMKILEQEETLLPVIIEKLKTSGNDVFIEHSIAITKTCRTEIALPGS
jgi:hypothetical protein